MNTYPPGPRANMDDAAWGLPTPPGRRRSVLTRAAVLTWISGAITFLFSGCIAGLLLLLTVMPEAELRRQFEAGNSTAEQVQQVMEVRSAGVPLSVGLSLVITLPALLLIVLGFFVKRRSRWAIIAAQVIVGGHGALLALTVLAGLASALTSGALLSAIPSLLLFGGMLALLVWTFRSLRAALYDDGPAGGTPQRRVRQPQTDDTVEPWNRHLSDQL